MSFLAENEGKDPVVNEKIDWDGLPHPGMLIGQKDPFYRLVGSSVRVLQISEVGLDLIEWFGL